MCCVRANNLHPTVDFLDPVDESGRSRMAKLAEGYCADVFCLFAPATFAKRADPKPYATHRNHAYTHICFTQLLHSAVAPRLGRFIPCWRLGPWHWPCSERLWFCGRWTPCAALQRCAPAHKAESRWHGLVLKPFVERFLKKDNKDGLFSRASVWQLTGVYILRLLLMCHQ